MSDRCTRAFKRNFRQIFIGFFFPPSYYILYNIYIYRQNVQGRGDGERVCKTLTIGARSYAYRYQWTGIILGVYTSRAHYQLYSVSVPTRTRALAHYIFLPLCVRAHRTHTPTPPGPVMLYVSPDVQICRPI